MPDSWDNLIMNLSHVTKLDMNSVITSLLSNDLRRKHLEASTPALRSQALVLEGERSKAKNKNINRKDNSRSRSKPTKDLKCFTVTRLVI